MCEAFQIPIAANWFTVCLYQVHFYIFLIKYVNKELNVYTPMLNHWPIY